MIFLIYESIEMLVYTEHKLVRVQHFRVRGLHRVIVSWNTTSSLSPRVQGDKKGLSARRFDVE